MMENPTPQEYGRTYIVLMPRDPNWMFSYWEVQPQTLSVFRKQFGAQVIDSSRPILRVFELSGSQGNGSGGQLSFELSVSLDARNWYVRVQDPGRTWFVELGLMTPDGRFVLLARSNKVRLPVGHVSDVMDARWMALKEGYDELIELSGVERIGKGSLEMAKMLSHRWEMMSGVSSWSSGAFSRMAPPKKQP